MADSMINWLRWFIYSTVCHRAPLHVTFFFLTTAHCNKLYASQAEIGLLGSHSDWDDNVAVTVVILPTDSVACDSMLVLNRKEDTLNTSYDISMSR